MFTKEFTGTQVIDWQLSDSEVSAWMNENRPGYWPFSNVQVRFHEGNVIEASGTIDLGKFMNYPMVAHNMPKEAVDFVKAIPISIPVYMEFDASFPGPKTPDIHLREVKIPVLTFTGESYGGKPDTVVNRVVSEMFNLAEQVGVTTFETGEGSLNIKGTWFEEMKRIPGN